jgi:hypothetical protein
LGVNPTQNVSSQNLPIRTSSATAKPVDPILKSASTTYKIEMNNDLGMGTFGSVKLAKDLTSKKDYAIKIVIY